MDERPTTAAPHPVPGNPDTDSYLTTLQVERLMAPIHPNRVKVLQGNSYVQGYDIEAQLTRIFGFGRWSTEFHEQVLLFEREVTMSSNRKGWQVAYRTVLTLVVRAPDGTELARHVGTHVGQSTHPDLGEAHGNACANSATYALKRAAKAWGDQFGLSLYGKGSMDALVRWTLVLPNGFVNDPTGAATPDTPVVEEEVSDIIPDRNAPTEPAPEPDRPARQPEPARPAAIEAPAKTTRAAGRAVAVVELPASALAKPDPKSPTAIRDEALAPGATADRILHLYQLAETKGWGQVFVPNENDQREHLIEVLKRVGAARRKDEQDRDVQATETAAAAS